MNSKHLLILLVTIFIYVNIYEPLVTQNKKNSSKLRTYKERLLLEKNFINHKKELEKYIYNSKVTLNQNENILYKANLQDSIIFNKMQSKVKTIVNKNNAKLLNILWGEPYNSKEALYINMPFTFILEIEPKKLYNLFHDLFKYSQSMTIKQIFITKKKNNLLVNMQIYLHKDIKL